MDCIKCDSTSSNYLIIFFSIDWIMWRDRDAQGTMLLSFQHSVCVSALAGVFIILWRLHDASRWNQFDSVTICLWWGHRIRVWFAHKKKRLKIELVFPLHNNISKQDKLLLNHWKRQGRAARMMYYASCIVLWHDDCRRRLDAWCPHANAQRALRVHIFHFNRTMYNGGNEMGEGDIACLQVTSRSLGSKMWNNGMHGCRC